MGGFGGAGILAGWFLTSLHARATQNLPAAAGFAVDAILFALALGFGRVLLGKAVQIALRRRFPDLRISIWRSVGPIGYAMLAATALAGFAALALAPVKPLWLDAFVHMLGWGG
jgi:hypothetical protein